MRNNIHLVCLAILIICSCSRPGVGLFSKKQSAHQKYTDSIVKEGNNKSSLGDAWLKASEVSIMQPFQLQLPYSEKGYFDASKPTANGFEFEVKRGTKLHVSASPGLFIDLFEPLTTGPRLLASAAEADSLLLYTVNKDGRYIVRLQPAVGSKLVYQLQIYAGPSLSFPVQRTGNPKIISLWGAGRDNGSRSHEGIDIAASFRTPALAGANGRITSVSENKLGGKVVFMAPDDADFNLYYAHLDTQMVTQGQRVKAGDIVGLVGNTGNAQYTVPHLHFGIYTSSGAIDPLLFVDNRQPQPSMLKIPATQLNTWVQSLASNILYNGPGLKNKALTTFSAGDSLLITGLNNDWARISSTNGLTGYIKLSKIKKESKKR